MSPARQADPELDSLIDEITVDCHDHDEQLIEFENAFDEDASFPCVGTVVGEDVEVLSVSTNNNRRELIATCQRSGRRYEVALLHRPRHRPRHLTPARRIPPLDRCLSRHLNSYRRSSHRIGGLGSARSRASRQRGSIGLSCGSATRSTGSSFIGVGDQGVVLVRVHARRPRLSLTVMISPSAPKPTSIT